MTEAWVWPIALGVLGAIVGSFIATLVVRWPEGRSAMRGRSACDACGRTLSAHDLIPLLSAAMLQGRCRTCAAPIDARHWRIELVAAGIGIAAGAVAVGPVAVAGAVFGWLLLALAALDIAALWLPDRLTLPLAVGGLATGSLGMVPTLTDRLIGGGVGFASLWLIATGYRRLRGREGMGAGDAKLFGAIGLWIGWPLLPAVLSIAALVGLAFAALTPMRGAPMRRDTALPLGAFLAMAAYPAWLVMIGSHP